MRRDVAKVTNVKKKHGIFTITYIIMLVVLLIVCHNVRYQFLIDAIFFCSNVGVVKETTPG